jgi:hypothetical protein
MEGPTSGYGNDADGHRFHLIRNASAALSLPEVAKYLHAGHRIQFFGINE